MVGMEFSLGGSGIRARRCAPWGEIGARGVSSTSAASGADVMPEAAIDYSSWKMGLDDLIGAM